MPVGKICRRVLITVSPWENIRTAAERMAENGVGTLVVTSLNGVARITGLVTDRDIALHCVAEGLDPDRTPVSTIMTNLVISVGEATPIESAMHTMASAGTHRLVVTGPQARPVGILSLDDVLDLLAEEVTSVGEVVKREAVLSMT